MILGGSQKEDNIDIWTFFKTFLNFLFIDLREKREREILIFDVPLTDALIGWLLYVPWPRIELTTLAQWDSSLTNWATWPGSFFFFFFKSLILWLMLILWRLENVYLPPNYSHHGFLATHQASSFLIWKRALCGGTILSLLNLVWHLCFFTKGYMAPSVRAGGGMHLGLDGPRAQALKCRVASPPDPSSV